MPNYRELKRLYDSLGPARACNHLTEALEAGHLSPQDFSLRQLAEAMVPDGAEWVRMLSPVHKSGQMSLLEAGGTAVDTAAFRNVTGQLIFSKIKQDYMSPAMVMSRIVPDVPTSLDGEKIPGTTQIGDQAEVVAPGKDFPTVGFSEDYQETPQTTKRGLICAVTKEAVFFDRMNLVLQQAGKVGEWLAVNKEKRLIDILIGATNNYKWRGVTYNTYATSGSWINRKASNPLTNWENVDVADQLWANMTDPFTGEPITIMGKQIIAMPANAKRARMILNATAVNYGDITTGTGNQTVGANPLAGSSFSLAESALAYSRLQSQRSISASNAAKYWYYGDFTKAFAYMQNWPLTVVQAPANNDDEFDRDVVAKFKASERGAAAVMDPRFSIENYDS